MQLYDAQDIAKALGLKGARMVIEQARKHFGRKIPVDEKLDGTPLPQGGRSKYMVSMKLTREQTSFIVSRSRGDTERARRELGLDMVSTCLMRNERLFLSVVESLLSVSDYSLQKQKSLSGFIVDGYIEGAGGCLVIEYDERYHKAKIQTELDTDRWNTIKNEVLSMGRDICLVRVMDTSCGFAEGVKTISSLLHSDFFGPVVYKGIESNLIGSESCHIEIHTID